MTKFDVKPYVFGAFQYKVNGEYVTFYRFSDEQLNKMKFNDFFFGRAKCSASIGLRFISDAQNLSFCYQAVVNATDNTFDLFINNQKYGSWKTTATLTSELHAKEEKVKFTLPEGNKEIVIYFPVESEIGIKDFCADGELNPIIDNGKKVLWIGDSITQGYGSMQSGQTIANLVSRMLHFDSLNQSISGYGYNTIIVNKMEKYFPNYIVVAMGTNNFKDGNTKEIIEQFYENISKEFSNVPICTITPYWRNDLAGVEDLWKELHDNIYATVEKYDTVSLVDGQTLIPHENKYFVDGVHPNGLGVQSCCEKLSIILKNIWKL